MPNRLRSVDFLRFLAIMAMFTAHAAPVSVYGNFWQVSEYLAMPLFAAVIGISAMLAEEHRLKTNASTNYRAILVKALSLMLIGVILELFDSYVYIVLVYLGLLYLLIVFIVKLSPWVMSGIGVLLFGLTTWYRGSSHRQPLGTHSDSIIEWFFIDGHPYRVGTLLIYAILGAALTRLVKTVNVQRLQIASLFTLGLSGLFFYLYTGTMSAPPLVYSGQWAEVLFNCLLVAGLTFLCFGSIDLINKSWCNIPVLMGQLAFTLYVLQIAWLGLISAVFGFDGIQTWWNFAVLLGGSSMFAWLWSTWSPKVCNGKGPIEWTVDSVARPPRNVIP